VIERVDPITLEVLRESNAFSVHYHNPDPERAALVTQRISDLFLTYNRQTRSERATETYEFLAEQARAMEARIVEAEKRIAQFKAENSAALPETQVRNQAAAERAERDLINLEGDMRAAEDRKAVLTLQLGKINPTLGGITGNPQTELAALQQQLADARVRYTPDHPDVKRLQRQIEALMAQTGGVASTVAEPTIPNTSQSVPSWHPWSESWSPYGQPPLVLEARSVPITPNCPPRRVSSRNMPSSTGSVMSSETSFRTSRTGCAKLTLRAILRASRRARGSRRYVTRAWPRLRIRRIAWALSYSGWCSERA